MFMFGHVFRSLSLFWFELKDLRAPVTRSSHTV
jgi:hypothetical protein